MEQLIANGKHGFAVDVAKQVHKRVGNAASEELLVCAYAARIISLAERDLDVEARALLELVQGRHPSSRDRLREVAATLKARGGGIEGLLELVADPSLPAEKVAGIEARIRSAAGDPARIAQCNALPLEHPLRVAAGAVVRALGAVTSGPVAAESLVLPEISRHSPLAPWKMLLRAIQALYANEDALCEKYLAAVEPTAAAARVVPAMRALMGQKQKLTPAAQDLVRKAGGGFAELRTTLANLDQALEKNNQGFALQEIGRAVSSVQRSLPRPVGAAQATHLGPRDDVRGEGGTGDGGDGRPLVEERQLLEAAGAGLRRNSARSAGDPAACSVWDEFRKHAVHEKWFPAKGPEVATLYLHMADLWRRIDDEQIERVVQRFAATFPGHGAYYAGQPAEIRELMPSGRLDCYFLSADALFGRACEADPCTENFSAMAQVGRAECAAIMQIWSRNDGPRRCRTTFRRCCT